MRKVWGTSHLALFQAFKAPASITQSPLKRVFPVSPDIRLEAVLSPSPSFTLEGGTRRNPLTRCRSWRTSSGCGNCPLGEDGECEPRAPATVLPSPPASPVTRGAAVSGAVSRVSSTGHRCRRPSLARPGDGWAVPTSSAAQSVPLLLPGEQEMRRPPVRPVPGRAWLRPCGSQLNRGKPCGDTDQGGV